MRRLGEYSLNIISKSKMKIGIYVSICVIFVLAYVIFMQHRQQSLIYNKEMRSNVYAKLEKRIESIKSGYIWHWRKIEKGIDRETVKQILGEPSHIDNSIYDEDWAYPFGGRISFRSAESGSPAEAKGKSVINSFSEPDFPKIDSIIDAMRFMAEIKDNVHDAGLTNEEIEWLKKSGKNYL